jgi:hypothetical protein
MRDGIWLDPRLPQVPKDFLSNHAHVSSPASE